MIVKKIYLSWRRGGKGTHRYLVGELIRQAGGLFTFQYDAAEVAKAKEEGFSNYPEFKDTDASIKYAGDLESIFSLRLMPESRADRNDYLNFWVASNADYDWFDELALTQGKLATDTFEFLGAYDYNINGFQFVTDLAALSHVKPSVTLVEPNDELEFELEPGNVRDGYAVKIMKGATHIGYVKRGHNLYFQNANPNRLKLVVRGIDKNGELNQLYILVTKKQG